MNECNNLKKSIEAFSIKDEEFGKSLKYYIQEMDSTTIL